MKLILPKDHIEHSLCGLRKTLEHHFLHYFLWKHSSLCEFTLSEGKKKTLKKGCSYNHGHASLFHFTNTYMQITPHSTDFSGDKYVTVWFLRCLSFWTPCLFWLSRFLYPGLRFFQLPFRLFHSNIWLIHLKTGKLCEMQ